MNNLDEIRAEIRRNSAAAFLVVSDVASGRVDESVIAQAKDVMAADARLWNALAAEIGKAMAPA